MHGIHAASCGALWRLHVVSYEKWHTDVYILTHSRYVFCAQEHFNLAQRLKLAVGLVVP
jgi:hypothetical protein